MADSGLLPIIKTRCGIPASITVYDDELQGLIDDALDDMATAGVPSSFCEDTEELNPRAITAVAMYVQATRGQDRSDSATYMRMYRNKLHKLMCEPDTEEGE